MTAPALFKEEPPKLIVNRRAIAAGLAALVAAPISAKEVLAQLRNVPLSLDTSGMPGMMKDGMFLPDHRWPMARLVFSDGSYTGWMVYGGHGAGAKKAQDYTTGAGMVRKAGSTPVCVEVCVPDKHGMPRWSQTPIG